jgi:membrane protein YqaA with SNARE-associated domain
VYGFAALWGLAEATFFFFVPDVLLSGVALRDTRRALWAGVFALAGAMIGGVAMYGWGAHAPQQAAAAVEAVPAISPALMRDAHDALAGQGALAMILGPLSGTPFKVYAVQAASAGISFGTFLLASIPARLPRFLLVALLAGLAAHALRRRFAAPTIRAIWLGAWVLFYAVYFARMPNA